MKHLSNLSLLFTLSLLLACQNKSLHPAKNCVKIGREYYSNTKQLSNLWYYDTCKNVKVQEDLTFYRNGKLSSITVYTDSVVQIPYEIYENPLRNSFYMGFDTLGLPIYYNRTEKNEVNFQYLIDSTLLKNK